MKGMFTLVAAISAVMLVVGFAPRRARFRGAVVLCAVLAATTLVAAAGARPTSARLQVQISSAPPSVSSSPAASFGFAANEQATFTCSLDRSRPSDCVSPKSYSDLAEGLHVFTVEAANTDASGRRYRAEDSYRWTVDVSPTPPPPGPEPSPPSPSNRVQLVVQVIGPGHVTSTPPGIGCPGECESHYATAAVVALVAEPEPGLRFLGWGAACEGTAGCRVRVDAPTFVIAKFGVHASYSDQGPTDSDRDGVPVRADACSDTPTGAKPLRNGCSATDLLQESVTRFHDIATTIGSATNRLRRIDSMASVRRRLEQSLPMLAAGVLRVSHADLCRGANTTRSGLRDLKAIAAVNGKLARAALRVFERPLDASTRLETGRLLDARSLVADATASATGLSRAFDAACSAITGRAVLTGRVAETDDEHRLVILEGGRRIALPMNLPGSPIAEGIPVRAETLNVGRGPSIATGIAAIPLPQTGATKAPPCLSFAIAPFQDFAKGKPILHDPRGYLAHGKLHLEYGSRAAVTNRCRDSLKGRYSAAFSEDTGWFSPDGLQLWEYGFDLEPGDPPVEFNMQRYNPQGTITVEFRYQGSDCGPPKAAPDTVDSKPLRSPQSTQKSYPCPVVVLSKATYEIEMYEHGTLAAATYNETVFSLEAGPQPAKLTSFKFLDQLALGSTVGSTFRAEALGPGGTGHITITSGKPFSIWPEAYYGLPTPKWDKTLGWTPNLLPLAGVDHFAGLVWPRVEGVRKGGYPFRYAVSLPEIITDLLPNCPTKDCFYRLPWQAGYPGTAFLTPIPKKPAVPSTVLFTSSAPTGVRAIRGGFVSYLNKPGGGWFATIQEQAAPGDQSYTQYELKAKIFQEGAEVKRGAPLGPSASFLFRIGAGIAPPCFEAFVVTGASSVFSPCMTPTKDSAVVSTNVY